MGMMRCLRAIISLERMMGWARGARDLGATLGRWFFYFILFFLEEKKKEKKIPGKCAIE